MVDTNSYYLNNVDGLNLGVVNPSNVRAYLNDPVNSDVINDFFSYFTGNTNQEEFKEIFYSDQKLSDLFTQYYSSSVLQGQQSSIYYIDQQLTGTTEINYSYSNFNWDGYANQKLPITGVTEEIYGATRFLNQSNSITTISTEESYYVPVFLKLNYENTSRNTFDACDKIVNLLLNPNALNEL